MELQHNRCSYGSCTLLSLFRNIFIVLIEEFGFARKIFRKGITQYFDRYSSMGDVFFFFEKVPLLAKYS